jgi:hypothetical protein
MTIKQLFTLTVFIFGFAILFPSCYYDKEETLYPFKKCDTTHVTFTQTIVPILSGSCYVCHFTGNQQTSIVLDTWPGVNAVALTGQLVRSVEQTGPFPMPKTGSKLDPCSINQIKKWVNDGAHQN